MKRRLSAHPKLAGWKAGLNEATALELQAALGHETLLEADR